MDLDKFEWISDESLDTIAELDDALNRLDGLSPRQGQLQQGVRHHGSRRIHRAYAR